jgi:hypothetical protein
MDGPNDGDWMKQNKPGFCLAQSESIKFFSDRDNEKPNDREVIY